MKKIWIILLVIILIVSLIIWLYKSDLFKPKEEYLPTAYEVSLIDYFKEIALNTEYDDNPERVTKWRKPMFLFIYKETASDEQMLTIQNTIESINNIASDGFRIEITNDHKKANAFLYLCKKEKVKEAAPKFYDLLNDDVINYDYTGLTYVEFKWTNFVITRALIFIDSESSIEEQKHAIVEEITQSIGLLNDSDKYPDSIFYEETDSIQNAANYQYSKMDIALINFLYNPKMKPGYKDRTVELVIKNILKDENNALNR